MRKVSRRTFVAGIAGTAAAGALPFSIWASQQARAQYDKPLTRYDVSTTEGQAMLEKYAQALTKMMDMAQTPEGNPSSWLFQWYTHAVQRTPPTTSSVAKAAEIARVYGAVAPTDPHLLLALETWNTCRSHGESGLPEDEDDFLPWHRMVLYFHERIVRTVLGDDTFTLPYWDYTTEGKRAIPEQFRMPADPLYKVLFRDNRNDGTGGNANVNAGEPIDINAAGDINLDSLARATYQDVSVAQGFNANLDFNLHGSIHVLTGNRTNMGRIPWAARDPIFWIHHCNIDRLWASWNKGGRPNPGDPWLGHTFVFADESGNRVSPVVSDFVDTETIAIGPYNYDKLEPVPPLPPAPAAAMMMATAPMIIADQAEPGPVMLNAPGEISVPLAPAGAPLGAQLTAGGENARMYLVLQNLQTDVQPGVLYNVFLGPASGGSGDAGPIGTINFFHAEAHGTEHTPAAHAPRLYSFDVTDVVTAAGAGDAEGAPTVRIAPVGTPEADATPVIGSISLVRQ